MARAPRWLWWSLLPALGGSVAAYARGGGGEHYTLPAPGGGGDGGIPELLLWLVVRLTVHYPHLMLPLLGIGALGYFLVHRQLDPGARTRKALARKEAFHRTVVYAVDERRLEERLSAADPSFDRAAFVERARQLFLTVQRAWFLRDLRPLRAQLSDATYQRLVTQLGLLELQGVRDAVTDVRMVGVQLMAFDQREGFDELHVRIEAFARDTDVPASTADEEAEAAARRAPHEDFVEVWTFVRRTGASTRAGQDVAHGKCPNCGAPFQGGATNDCAYCGAVVNSGNHDWVLAEITQGEEYLWPEHTSRALAEVHGSDPELSLPVLEDRASLVFWRWIAAQSRGQASLLAKLAAPEELRAMDAELQAIAAQGRRKVFLQCAVGAVNTRVVVRRGEREEAHVEIRWSARMAVTAFMPKAADLTALPQRWIFTLTRQAGAKTNPANGMSTYRCGSCGAPLTDSLSSSCDHCGTDLAAGAHDWVLLGCAPFEAWMAQRNLARVEPIALPEELLADGPERERLLHLLASVAAADGELSPKERGLLKMCAERWSIPWATVERAFHLPTELLGTPARGSPEAKVFLTALVAMARIDGRIDRRERRLLEAAAAHLALSEQLPALLGTAKGERGDPPSG
jgi:predicted lipid-binding transport protein (Tim44 family)/tellurite resistance protein